MGTYVITGGTSGIGLKTAELLKKEGHRVLIVSHKKGDIIANLSTAEGRQYAIDNIYELCPDGLDGLVCSAAVDSNTADITQLVSLNFYGTITIVQGLYDLLKKKKGNCVITTSNTISQGNIRMDLVNILNNHNDNEERILRLLNHLESETGEKNQSSMKKDIYVAAKYALARWMRVQSSSYAANGIHLNAVAPGNIDTPMTGILSRQKKNALNELPIPIKYGKEEFMESSEVAPAITFLLSDAARGINGIILFVDGGTDALLNAEKVY